MYGPAEGVAGDLLAESNARDKAFIATKVWTEGRAAGIAQMQESMARFRTDHIDLMQIHNLVDWRTHLATLRNWQKEKKFRYIGLTHYTDAALEELGNVIRAEPIDFVQCAYSIGARAAEPPERQLQFRIGINVGDVLADGDDILGDSVNIAARLEGIAEPGGICLSAAAYEQVRGKLELAVADMGEQDLKNIARPLRTYRVVL